jgi:hypothetical protein
MRPECRNRSVVFPYVDSPSQRWWLLGLLLLWAGFLFGGFLLGPANEATNRRMPTWTRMASSLTLVVAAWSWYSVARPGAAGSFSLWIALGVTLGFLGDLCMAGLLPVSQPILGAIAAFGLGHVAYLTALVWFGNQQQLTAPGPRWGALAAWLTVGVAGWLVIVQPSSQPAALRWAALPYTLLLASVAGLATGLAWQAPALGPLALGTGLFLASDLILAGEIFGTWRFPLLGDVVWLTYGPGQMLIIYAVSSALAVVQDK